ncbi:MAG TPA: FkbM family methyltransferase [Isosphaeraceae bacterium]|jgi:hypothetical protein|nr:FkbM family methyltransferase [Isosphaeraceae bacterium]
MIWDKGAGDGQAVEIRALDGLLEGRTVDLMKVDVEGFEPHVIEGALKSITEGRIRAILCEFNDKALKAVGSSSHEFHDRLVGIGFRDVDPRPIRDDTWLENRRLIHVCRA